MNFFMAAGMYRVLAQASRLKVIGANSGLVYVALRPGVFRN